MALLSALSPARRRDGPDTSSRGAAGHGRGSRRSSTDLETTCPRPLPVPPVHNRCACRTSRGCRPSHVLFRGGARPSVSECAACCRCRPASMAPERRVCARSARQAGRARRLLRFTVDLEVVERFPEARAPVIVTGVRGAQAAAASPRVTKSASSTWARRSPGGRPKVSIVADVEEHTCSSTPGGTDAQTM